MRKHWTLNEIQQLRQAVKHGVEHAVLAQQYGVAATAIASICAKHKIHSAKSYRWSSQELKTYKRLFAENPDYQYIATKLGRSYSAVLQKAHKLHLLSPRAKTIVSQLALKKKGLRRCHRCQQIFPHTKEHFFNLTRRTCITCSRAYSNQYQAKRKANMTLDVLLAIRLNQAKQRAERKGVPFQLTVTQLKVQYELQQGLCAYSQLPLEIQIKDNKQCSHTLSIDRIIPDLGYTATNIVLCSECVNTMKNSMTVEQFYTICRRIAGHPLHLAASICATDHPFQPDALRSNTT